MIDRSVAMDESQVIDVIQRWREAPVEDLKPEDFQEFTSLGSACLTRGGGKKLLTFIGDERNQGLVRSMGHALLPPLVNEVVQKERRLEECQDVIAHLTVTCSPRGLLVALLEIIENVDPGRISETIIFLVPHLVTVLLRQDEQRAASVGSVLSALHGQLARLPVPYTGPQVEADEFGLCRCCAALAAVIKPLAEETKRDGRCGVSTEEQEELKAELIKFCMRSLRQPLLEAELSLDQRSSPLRILAAEIMVTLATLQDSIPEVLFFSSTKRSPLVDRRHTQEARACLAYLLFVQLITMETFPAVFSPVFVLRCNLEHIDQLISSKKESHVFKGLALLEKSLEKVEEHSLPESLLELSSFYSVAQNLRRVLTDCPIQQLRKSALQQLQPLISRLDVGGKHKFFRFMLKTSNHSGVEGLVVRSIRSQVELSLKPDSATRSFLGEDFLSLLGLVFCLPGGAETDLLGSMDRIMESLNLLRYLLIRDKEMRNAAVWKELSAIKDQYLKMLQVCISMSREYYSAELKALKEDRKLKAREARAQAGLSRSLKRTTVTEERVRDMSPQEQQQVLQSALVTFDLMESLTVRIEEIAKEKIPN